MRTQSAITRKPSRQRQPAIDSQYQLRVLFLEHKGAWCAQVLEHDIATQAKTLPELFHEVERILVAHVAIAAEDGHPPFEGIPPAPRRYWRLYERSHITVDRPLAGYRLKTGRTPVIHREIRVAEPSAA